MSKVYLSELTGGGAAGGGSTGSLSSHLESDNVKDAIDELAADIKAITTPPEDILSAITNLDDEINS